MQVGPDGRLQYEYMLRDNQTYTELVVVDPGESCAPCPACVAIADCSMVCRAW